MPRALCVRLPRPGPRFALAVSLTLAAAACGGGGSRGPGPVTSDPGYYPPEAPPPAPLVAGAVLTFLSGETGEAVAGAAVGVGGRPYTSDGEGRITLTEDVETGALLEVTAPGFLTRQTLLRAPDERRFTLWPGRSPTGLDEAYTAVLVYTDSALADAPAAAAPLSRLAPATRAVTVAPSAPLRSDPEALRAHEEAVSVLNDAAAGSVVYSLGSAGPGVFFETRVDGADKGCVGRIRAFTRLQERGREIVGGEVVFCSPDVARSVTVLHELGHTFGLQHSPDPAEVMYTFFVAGRGASFSPRELLAMSLMTQRRAGNRFPDRDLESAAAATRTRTIACP